MKAIKSLLVLLILSSTALIFTSCDDDDDDMMQTPATVVDIATGDAQFSILVNALTKANLVTTLQGNGPFTVFAPTNTAFNQLFSDLLVSSLDDLDSATLAPILLYHVLDVEAPSSGLSDGYVSALSAGPASTNVSLRVDTNNGVVLNGDVNVSSPDNMAGNGIVHVINKVLLPPNVVDLAIQNPAFSTLVAALTRGDLPTDFVTALSAPGPFTVFAPTNDAFQALLDSNPDWNTLNDIPAATLDAVLKYHVVSGANVQSGGITDGASLTTLQGSSVTANVNGSGVSLTDGQGNTADVIIADVQGTNGVVHAINSVILF